VPAEGFSIALLRRDGTGAPVALSEPRVSATGAEVRPGPEQPLLRTFLVLPRAGVREVRVQAQAQGLEAEARYVLGPPATQVSIALEPVAPVKGQDKEARLMVRMVRPDGTPDDSGAPPVLRASVGQVEGLERTGPGTWQARYVLPQTRYPEVAILVALSAWPHPQSIHGAFGAVRVPLAASVDLPGESDPRASVSLEVAGKTFGPVRTGPDGRFRLPIIVPPGHRFALVRAVDDDGNTRRTRLDLKVPPTDRLACVLNPQRLPAEGGARARLLCATSDVYGAPTEDTRVKAQARHGTLRGPTRTEDSLLEWVYTAPGQLPATPELAPLFQAVAERATAGFGYRGERRRLDPHRLTFARGRWYVEGHDHARGELRQFRLDRIEGEIAVGAAGSFERPEVGRAHTAHAWEIGREDGEVVTAVVRIDADQAPWVRRDLGEGAVLATAADGAIDVAVQVRNADAFRSWVLGFLDHAEVLEPPGLRADLVAWLRTSAA